MTEITKIINENDVEPWLRADIPNYQFRCPYCPFSSRYNGYCGITFKEMKKVEEEHLATHKLTDPKGEWIYNKEDRMYEFWLNEELIFREGIY